MCQGRALSAGDKRRVAGTVLSLPRWGHVFPDSASGGPGSLTVHLVLRESRTGAAVPASVDRGATLAGRLRFLSSQTLPPAVPGRLQPHRPTDVLQVDLGPAARRHVRGRA